MTDKTDMKFWDNLAERYAARPVGDPEAFTQKIAITKARMTAGSRVLNIGCGTGSLALRLADTGADLHGLDISPEMIRIARDKVAAANVDNITFHIGSFNTNFTAFAPESLDGICAYSFLHLVEDRTAALAQIFRLLKPGGFFISSTVCLAEGWVPYRPMLAVMRLLGKAPMIKVVRRKTVLREIQAAGFIECSEPDVGSQSIVGFMVATKPE